MLVFQALTGKLNFVHLREGANKSHVYSASAYGLGCKAWFAANGPSPLQEAQHSRQACKPRPSGLSQQPALCVIRLRQAPACLQSDALNANCCASHSLQKRRPRGLIRTFLSSLNHKKAARRRLDNAIRYIQRRQLHIPLCRPEFGC